MEMHLDKIYYDYILNGKKIYEIRIYDEKRQQINLLDIIKFIDRSSENTFNGKIVELSYFSNFRDAIEEVGIKSVLPNVRSLKEGIKTYENFPHKEGNYKKASEKYGVLRIKFEIN